ncbi:hypothetical protein [Lutibacter sp. B1]|uniref:hypothetical protein n=1 Tax=Lutibacter sp. B1 TaxID=2725996 RepID=UPI001456DB18|nr:hypothetical protein [Lutibacter sp. B1]NLP59530.1 hypothetical protein [Lutibacter sp. B1]
MKELLKKPIVIIIILIALVFIGGDIYNRIVLGDDYGKEFNVPKNTSNYLSDNEAVYASQKFVESRLKSPKTADFQPMFQAKVKRENDIYTITSYVDSQNGFGAIIRSNYIVKLKRKSNGDVSLIDIKIE